jgi:diguanylate cyclase (GGDEF)-like protein
MKDILLQGMSLVLALATLLVAGDLAFKPETPEAPDIRAVAAALASASALGVLLFQYLYFSGLARVNRYRDAAGELQEETASLRSQVKMLEQDRRFLRQQVESLSAHRELSRAASANTSFEDLLDELAGVVHDTAGAESLSIFLNDSGGSFFPKAVYRVSDATELYLSFSETGSLTLGRELEDGETLDGELLSAKRISVTPRGEQIIIGGALYYRNSEIGTVKFTHYNLDQEQASSGDIVRALLAGEFGHVRLDAQNIKEARENRKPLRYDNKAKLAELACPLVADEEILGVVKVWFDCRGDEDRERTLSERQRLLRDSATHIARALRSERIYEQAIKDGLTGLFNKRHMVSQMENYFTLAARHGTHLSMILLDIDHFKKVNDTYGHLTGDIILREVSAIMRENIRSCDLACRYGGEELAVILPEGSLTGTRDLAERLRKKIEESSFTGEKGETVKVTASLGVADFDPAMRRIEDLIARVDAVLYEAKEGGRNRVIAWENRKPLLKKTDSARVSKRAMGKS